MLLLSISSLNKSKLEYRLKVLSNKINRKLHLRTYKNLPTNLLNFVINYSNLKQWIYNKELFFICERSFGIRCFTFYGKFWYKVTFHQHTSNRNIKTFVYETFTEIKHMLTIWLKFYFIGRCKNCHVWIIFCIR